MMTWNPFASVRRSAPALALAADAGVGVTPIGNGDFVAPCGSREAVG